MLRTSARRCSSHRFRRTTVILLRRRGPACDIRHRFALSAVYDIPGLESFGLCASAVTKDWHVSTVYQVQTGFPFTISVFGDTANSGTVLGENPIRANSTGAASLSRRERTPLPSWFNPAAFATPAAYTFGDVGRNSVYGPGLQTLDLAFVRDFNSDGAGEVPVPRGVLQRSEPYESRNARSLREYAAVRHHHRGDDAGTDRFS